MWTQGWRHRLWTDLDQQWDIIIIGGGITGAGILREAAQAGLRVLLLESQDFASGTSSRSSKLVHGGLRYLRNAQFKTTLDSVHEREQLLRQGEGLVNPINFLYAHYKGGKTSPWLMEFGLTIYDIFALHWNHQYHNAPEVETLAPHLNQANLLGGHCYGDAQTDDARLVLRVLREGVRAGGTALNYAPVIDLLRQHNGRVCGVVVEDTAEQMGTAEIEAAVVINATGASADMLRRKIGEPPRLRSLRGSHLIFPTERLPISKTISFDHPVDGRPVFAIPWEGVTLFGTTDVDHRQNGQEPSISPAELDYLMEAATFAFPDLALTTADIPATFAGVRSVIDTGKADPSKESREHALWDENGILTVTGGKLTTFRVMAREALKIALRHLPERPSLPSRPVLDPLDDCYLPDDLDPAEQLRLLGRYGAEACDLVEAAYPNELTPIHNGRSLWAELRWAARAEGVVHLDDLLLRRVRLGLLLPNGGLPWLDQIRTIVQPELGWDNARWWQETAAYANRWHFHYHLP
ncbi:MAG: glycerol-3-phosphate dehydrogenase/oxidase, partial [Candidatus Promineifilaceae bacterium]